MIKTEKSKQYVLSRIKIAEAVRTCLFNNQKRRALITVLTMLKDITPVFICKTLHNNINIQTIETPYSVLWLKTSLPLKDDDKSHYKKEFESLYSDFKSAEDPSFRMDMPTLSGLTGFIKENRKGRSKSNKKHLCYDFGENYPLVNAEYLRNMLFLLGEHIDMYCCGNFPFEFYFVSDLGEGILLPVRRPESSAREINQGEKAQ